MAQLNDLLVYGKSIFAGHTQTGGAAYVEGTIYGKNNITITRTNAPTNPFLHLQSSTGSTYLQLNGTTAGLGSTWDKSLQVDTSGNVTIKGVLHTKGSLYEDAYTGALNLNNSNIYGVNSIYTCDTSDGSSEGIHFYRSATTVDSLQIKNGFMYFTPNRTLGTAGTSHTVLHTGMSGGVFYVTGNSGGTAGTWTGSNTNIPNLYTGLTIAYKILTAGASTTTLNLTTAAGASGAKTVMRNDSNLTTHVPVNGVVLLTYDGTYWRWADYSTSNTSVTQSRSTTSSWRPVLSHVTAGTYGSDPGSKTDLVYYIETIAIQPSTGTLKATAVQGAVWNDYAEFRTYKDSDKIPYGRVVIENGDDSLSLATERLQLGGNICSDTFGFSVGETDNAKLPIAVSGRVLAYVNEPRDTYKPGEALCSGPNGTVSKMTREEIKEYPDAIIGYVSAVPDYEIWGTGNVKVDGRIWVKIK